MPSGQSDSSRRYNDPRFVEKSKRGGSRARNDGGWNRSPYGPLVRTTVQLSPEVRVFLQTQESQGGWIETMTRSTVEFMLWQAKQPKMDQ